MRAQIGILILFALLLLTSARADGPEPSHGHPSEDAGIHHDFYRSWMRPDNPTQSCCSLQDCAPVVQVRRVAGRYEAKTKFGKWVVVPPEKVEQRRDSPDGRSHLCWNGPTVFCFVLGSGT